MKVKIESGNHLECVSCRRQVIGKPIVSLLITTSVSNSPAIALASIENHDDVGKVLMEQSKKRAPQKPFAPTTELLPALRVKTIIDFDHSLSLVEEYSFLIGEGGNRRREKIL